VGVKKYTELQSLEKKGKSLRVPRSKEGPSQSLLFTTLPFAEEGACRRVKQLELFLGL
jgi:hypothetical protein